MWNRQFVAQKLSKQVKFLKLHAILIQEKNHTGLGYTYVLPFQIKNRYLLHVAGSAFCLFLKAFKPKFFHLLEW